MSNVVNEQLYADGFNKGYWLFTYERDIAKSFIDNEVVIYDDFSDGFSQGLLQAEQEITLNEFEQLRNDSNEHDLSLER